MKLNSTQGFFKLKYPNWTWNYFFMVDVELEGKFTLKNQELSNTSLVPLNEQLTPKMELKLGGNARECNTFSNEVQVFENQRETILELLIDQKFQGVLNIKKKKNSHFKSELCTKVKVVTSVGRFLNFCRFRLGYKVKF